MKKFFIIYHDQSNVFDDLTDEEAGKLIKCLSKHAKGEEYQINGLLKVVLSQFINQIDRDYQKYDRICDRNRENGKLGGRPKTQSVILGFKNNPEEPKKPKKNKNKNKNKNNNKNNIDNTIKDININNSNKDIIVFSENENLNKTILDFIDYRKKSKKPMSDNAVKLLIKKLDTLSNNDQEKIEILENSIVNGWQGVFPLKKENTGLSDNMKAMLLIKQAEAEKERQRQASIDRIFGA